MRSGTLSSVPRRSSVHRSSVLPLFVFFSLLFGPTSQASTPQTLTFPPLANQKLSAATFTLAATSSSGLPVEFTSLTPPVCTVAGSVVTLLSAGTCTIQADQAGDATYAPAASVTQTFLVTQTGIVTQPFPYTGANQTFVVPSGITKLTIAMWGGGGAEYGGAGGHTTGTLAVSPGEVLTVLVGGGGLTALSGVAPGGFGGGANGLSDGTRQAGGGGGRSAVWFGTSTEGAAAAVYGTRRARSLGARAAVIDNRIELLTAAGGGGGNGGLDAYGGGGGGMVGASGLAYTGSPSGQGGTQTAGGSGLFGAAPGAAWKGGASALTGGGGGGGGYFGGGGGGSSNPAVWGGGGGGSSYILGTSVNADSRLPGDNGGTQPDGGALPAHNTDADPYQLRTARGGGSGANGGNGLVLITYAYEQTISFGALPDQPMSASPVLGATASSDLPVAFESLTPDTCGVSGAQVTLRALGTCTIEASQSGDSDWAPAEPVQRSFQVLAGNQTISFGPLANQVFGTPGPALTASASSGLPVEFASLTTGICTVSGSAIALLAIGTCTVQATQPGDASWSPAAPVSQSFLITNGDQTIAFAFLSDQKFGTAPALSATATSGLPVSFSSLTGAVCAVSGSTVSLSAIGTCTIRASQPGDAKWHAAPTVDQTFQVVKGDQTIAFGALADRKLGSAPATVAATATSGLPVSFSSTTESVCTVAAATITVKAVGTCTVRASQAGDTHWNAAPNVDQSFQVAKSDQTISFAPLASQKYGTTPPALSATATSGLSVSFSSDTAAVCTVSGTAITLQAVGTCAIRASQPGDSTWGAAAVVIQSFQVSKGDQTIAFGALGDQKYGTTPPALSATATSGLAVAFSSMTDSVCTVSGTTISITAIGTCTVRASQAGDSNWNAAPGVDRSFQVTKGDQTVAFSALPDQVYGTPPPVLSATATSGLPVSFSYTTAGVCTVSGTTISISAAGTCTIRASQAGNANWNAAPNVDRSFQATQATQTITFGSLADQALSAGSIAVGATASSGLPVDFATLTGSVCTVSGTTLTLKAVGTCTIRASQPGDGNYSAATPVNQSFQVTQTSQTVAFGALPDKTYGDGPFGVSATASSGLAVSFSSLTAACTVSGTTVTIVSAGLCTIRASQPGDLTYSAATLVDQSFTVQKASPVITWSNPTGIVYGTALSGTQLNATANVPGSFVHTPASGAVLGAGNGQMLSATFTPADTTNYKTSSASVSIDVSKAPATATLGVLSFVYDGAPKPTSATTAPAGLAVSITYDGSTTAPSAVGTYAVVATVTDPNYTGSANGTLTISASVTFNSSPAGQQITVDGTTQAAPFTLVLSPGAHTVSVASLLAGPSGTRYVWSGWSDGGAISHTINVTASGSYTANFKTQYWLQTSSFPVAGGTISPASGFFDAGSTVSVSTTVNPGYSFADFSGGVLSGSANPQNLVMNGPGTVVANYTTTAPQLAASVGARADGLAPGTRDVAITLTNNGTGTAFNATIQSLTDFAIIAGSGSVSVAAGTPANLGTINTGGASATGVVTLNWPTTATRVQFRVNYTAAGGYSNFTTVTINR